MPDPWFLCLAPQRGVGGRGRLSQIDPFSGCVCKGLVLGEPALRHFLLKCAGFPLVRKQIPHAARCGKKNKKIKNCLSLLQGEIVTTLLLASHPSPASPLPALHFRWACRCAPNDWIHPLAGCWALSPVPTVSALPSAMAPAMAMLRMPPPRQASLPGYACDSRISPPGAP